MNKIVSTLLIAILLTGLTAIPVFARGTRTSSHHYTSHKTTSYTHHTTTHHRSKKY